MNQCVRIELSHRKIGMSNLDAVVDDADNDTFAMDTERPCTEN